MALNIHAELKRLGTLKTPQLKARYAELFGEPTRCNNRPYLIKRIAWRLQADAEGDLSERARQRAAELADDADLRLQAPLGAPRPTTISDAPSPKHAIASLRVSRASDGDLTARRDEPKSLAIHLTMPAASWRRPRRDCRRRDLRPRPLFPASAHATQGVVRGLARVGP